MISFLEIPELTHNIPGPLMCAILVNRIEENCDFAVTLSEGAFFQR
jgi:hypothetical protein